MRTLAIDLGARRIGLAMSDEGGRFATPLEVLQVSSSDQASRQIMQLIAEEKVERIVVGLLSTWTIQSAEQREKQRHGAKNLAQKSGKEVIFVDERLSSFAAEQELIERKRAGEKITRKREKERLDALAAAGFLQAFLDGKLKPIDL